MRRKEHEARAVVWPSGRLPLVPWLAGAAGSCLVQEVGTSQACWGVLGSTACTRVRGSVCRGLVGSCCAWLWGDHHF